jgi:hypothetical protein
MDSMGKITDAVISKQYREALIFQALKLAEQLDNLKDEKNLAPVSRELRIILVVLGLDEGSIAQKNLDKLRKAANDYL